MIFEHRLEEGGQAMQIFRVKSSEIEATGFAKALGENELGMIKEEQNTQGYIYKAEIQTELGNYAQAWDTLRIAPKDKFASEIFKKYTCSCIFKIR